MSRIGAASGVISFVITFVGFGVHGGLPSDTTPAAIESYVKGVSAAQTGVGNYLELLGYVLFLAFAAYLCAFARATSADRLHWINGLSFAAATTYVAVSAIAIACQQVIVESSKAGIDPKFGLDFYILDNVAFTMSFELLAMFAIALGFILMIGALPIRAIGVSAIVAGVILLITGLIGTVSILTSVAQVGLLLFELWVVVVSVYLVVRPARISRSDAG